MQTVCSTYRDAGKGNLTAQNTRKPGLRPDPAEGTYNAPAKNSWWGGACCPLPNNPISALGPSGLASSTPTPKLVPTPMPVPPANTTLVTSFSEVKKLLWQGVAWDS